MPRKKKSANEMDDREILKRVFPERVIRRVEEEIGLREPRNDDEREEDSPDND